MSIEGKISKLESDQVESLRLILERKQMRQVSPIEAVEVGESLMEFYEVLASDGNSVMRGNTKHGSAC